MPAFGSLQDAAKFWRISPRIGKEKRRKGERDFSFPLSGEKSLYRPNFPFKPGGKNLAYFSTFFERRKIYIVISANWPFLPILTKSNFSKVATLEKGQKRAISGKIGQKVINS